MEFRRGDQVEFAGAGVRLVGEQWSPTTGADGPEGTVLLLHGGGQTRHSWFRTAEALAKKGWTAIALDARSHSDSEWSPVGDYSVDAMVDDLAAVVGRLGERPVLVLVDIAATVEPDGVKRITDFMSANPDGFASLDEVAEAVRAYNPRRRRSPNPAGLRKNVRLGDTVIGAPICRRWRWWATPG